MKSPDVATSAPIALTQLQRGDVGVVTGLVSAGIGATADERESMLARLRDIGFVAGAHCEVIARMWFGGDPVAVRIGGSTFALRRIEAAAVRVVRAARTVAPAAMAAA